jgi:diguanylate cyclase
MTPQPLLPTEASPAEPASALSNVTVMMIDDDPMMTEVIQTYLEEAGYRRFVAVNDPLQAMAAARSQRPGLILLDLMMPGLNGFDLLAQIRADEALAYTPVIVLTASNDTENKLRALELGATEFLAKPVDESELKIRVRNSLAFKVFQDRLANDDPLTGLPNRRVFVEHLRSALERCQRSSQRLALIHVNLDRFRIVNDTLGHAFGDALLAAVAERLRTSTRAEHSLLGNRLGDSPVLARLGGDEFGVLLADIDTPDPADRVSRRIIGALAEPFSIGGRDIYITPSVGIAVFPEDGRNDALLLRNAGAAMMFAKDAGRNSFHFYSEDLNNASIERLQMENQLRRAIERDELRLYYQPKVDLKSDEVVGAEALLRWQHPELGLVSAGQFIPIAEESGLIVEIGEWVLRAACEQVQRWRESTGQRVRVAVNIARHGLVSGTLHHTLRGLIDKHGISPGQLSLELTESMLMDRVETTAAKLSALRALGVELSIDDFGTGYSSMSYLKQFPVQELKIDRSFVAGTPHDRIDTAIVRALVLLAGSLGMRVVAEGVESEGQRAALETLGCDLYQGFLCAPALPADDYIALADKLNGKSRALASA